MIATAARRKAALAGSLLAVVAALSGCGSSDSGDALPATGGTSTTERCAAGAACTTSVVTLDATTLTVAAEASRGAQTVSARLIADATMHCPGFTSVGGAVAEFSSTAPDAAKTVTYTLTGAPARAAAAAYAAHPTYLGCYGAPKSFKGYTGTGSSRAVFVREDGLYEAQLLACTSDAQVPCFRYRNSGSTVSIVISAPAGDPRTTI